MFLMLEAIIVIVALTVGLSTAYFWKNNNPIEEISESIIENELGLPAGSIDLDVPEFNSKKSTKKTSKKAPKKKAKK